MTSTLEFFDDGSDPQPGASRGGGLPWLPKEAAGVFLQAYITVIEEGEHQFTGRTAKFLRAAVNVRYNMVTYRQELTFWGTQKAKVIPLLRAIGVKRLSSTTKEALNQLFQVKFAPNAKGYLDFVAIQSDGQPPAQGQIQAPTSQQQPPAVPYPQALPPQVAPQQLSLIHI